MKRNIINAQFHQSAKSFINMIERSNVQNLRVLNDADASYLLSRKNSYWESPPLWHSFKITSLLQPCYRFKIKSIITFFANRYSFSFLLYLFLFATYTIFRNCIHQYGDHESAYTILNVLTFPVIRPREDVHVASKGMS